MLASHNDTEPQRPAAILHILLRDGSVIDRNLVSEETKIGKGPLNDIILADASVSSTHAMISYADGVYSLSDLGSRNGTILNDARVTEPRTLQHGDLIKMGHCTLTFRLKDASDTLSMTQTQILDPTEPPPPPTPPPVPKPPAINEDVLRSALISSGLVAQAEVERSRGTGAKGRRLCRALLEEKLVSEIGLRDLMSRTFNIPPVELKTMDVDASAAAALRLQFLREKLVCPVVGQSNDQLLIAMADPTDKATIDEVERITRKKASLRLAVPSEIAAQLDNHFTPRLIGVTPAGEKIEATLNQVETDIGKASHNRLVISDPTVSNTHAIVIVRDGGYNIVDLGSSNGTFINGQSLGNNAHTLQHGDKIQLGQVVLTFRNPAETTENKTTHLSLEALEEVRRRAHLQPASGGRAAPFGRDTLEPNGAPQPSTIPTFEEEEKKGKKKKKKEDDRIKAALVNSTSRILATVLSAVLTIVIAVYIMRGPTPSTQTGTGQTTGTSTSTGHNLVPSGSWKGFNTGLFGAALEASGVAYAPGSNGVLLVSDNREGEVLWMQLDEDGKQVGSIKPVPLGASFVDPEAITYGNSYFYLVTSQSEPKNGAKNALIRFDFNSETQSLRSPAEIVSDFRTFLLSNVPDIASLGAPSGVEGGLNIEGIAWDPNNERLLLGLRSPLIGNQAVLIPLKLRNPRGPFRLDNLRVDDPRVIVLSLNGHGVRDITYDTRLKNFLIISGAPENVQKTDFVLWEWNGQPDSKPLRLMTLDDKVKPEGLTSLTINNQSFIFVVSDAGSYLKINYQ
ncbi:MAG: DUF3616 domain-containing protein [Acidobacteria bacterium]|nr:DUF3616 domain-containing protein [Acidobacteriota bacterium]